MITDNGTGIKDAKKAMTPTSQQKTGTGLGLPIVTKIINEHSGNFSIKIKKRNWNFSYNFITKIC